MIGFLILLATTCVMCALDAITTNRGIARGAQETSMLIPGKPTPFKVWALNVEQMVVCAALFFPGDLRELPWVVCGILPAMMTLAHGVAVWHNWAQAYPKAQ